MHEEVDLQGRILHEELVQQTLVCNLLHRQSPQYSLQVIAKSGEKHELLQRMQVDSNTENNYFGVGNSQQGLSLHSPVQIRW